MEKPKQERQNKVRHRVLKGAQIVFKGREAVIDCVVRNLRTEAPASKWKVPSEFQIRLILLDNAPVRSCRVTWRKATQIGRRFFPASQCPARSQCRRSSRAAQSIGALGSLWPGTMSDCRPPKGGHFV
jgi:hypothetical protein